MERSPKYWMDFAAHGDLKAVGVKTGKSYLKHGRGNYLVGLALKMVRAGLWTDVQVKAMNGKAWIDLAELDYREHGPGA